MPQDADGSPTEKAHTLTAIPYYAWAHRDTGEMSVWLPTSVEYVER